MKSAAPARRPHHLRRAGAPEMCGAALPRGRVKGGSLSRSWKPESAGRLQTFPLRRLRSREHSVTNRSAPHIPLSYIENRPKYAPLPFDLPMCYQGNQDGPTTTFFFVLYLHERCFVMIEKAKMMDGEGRAALPPCPPGCVRLAYLYIK